MILIDINQVVLSGLMAQIDQKKKFDMPEEMFRHIVLNIIRSHVKKFKNKYGEVIICCDNRKYWRKEVFEFYKASRKKSREKSKLDWHYIFDMLTKFKEEIKQNMPYKVIDVEGAEADDIIATLTESTNPNKEKVLVLSSDNDFLQLQMFKNVAQYNPATKKFLVSETPIKDLKLKVIQGDKGDGIPNVLSPGDTFVSGGRQKSLTEANLTMLLDTPHEDWTDDTAKKGFERNRQLIDFRYIPKDLKEKIMAEYNTVKPQSRQKMFSYFIEKRLTNLMDVIEEF
jgi:hypothetical protein